MKWLLESYIVTRNHLRFYFLPPLLEKNLLPINVPDYSSDSEFAIWNSAVQDSCPVILQSRKETFALLRNGRESERTFALESFIYCWWSDDSSLRLLAMVAEHDPSIAVRYTAASTLLVLHIRAYGSPYRNHIKTLLHNVIAANKDTPVLVSDILEHLACWSSSLPSQEQ
jgi:hypothetical protein